MKKVFSLLLAVLMLVSALPVAYAAESGGNWSSGTTVVYTAANAEGWTLTVPAKLAPGGSGPVTLQGTWPSNKQITVTAQKNVVLTNSINAANQKSLDISFVGISELGSDTSSQSFTETISVEPMANALFGTWNGVFYYTVGTQELDTVSQLQAKHEFEYYSTMNAAVNDVNNGAIGTSADSDKEDAVAGIYTDENGGVNVVLLKDHKEATRIKPSVDMTINLGGNTLSSDDNVVIQPTSGNITIDGRINGSSVIATSGANAQRAIQAPSGNLIIDGGTYIANSENSNSVAIISAANLTVSNATISATSGSSLANAFELMGGIVNISNCDITSISDNAAGIISKSDSSVNTTISNSSIKAYSNYTYNDDESAFSALSSGIENGTTNVLTLNNCYVMGTHSGVSNRGTLYVNGGTYEGYGHGGVYFGGTDTTSYVRNATIRQSAMPNGYTASVASNGAGLYIGGTTGNNNISIYMDNCDIYSSNNQIVLRGSADEQNNSLYISNSNLYNTDGSDVHIRIDNDTHRLYIGTGNNFTSEDASYAWISVVETDETYIYNG